MSDTHDPSVRQRRATRPARSAGGLRADRRTAVQFLNACVEAEIACFGEILRYVGANTPRTRRLLEDVLRLEEEHAQELLGVLQIHRAATDP